MRLFRFSLPATIFASLALTACEETNTIGDSLVGDKVEIIEDTTFTITAEPLSNPAIRSRTLYQLLGSLDARGFGRLSSDFVTQFMPASELDTTGVVPEDVDSVHLLMFMNPGGFTGDSLVPMGLHVYRLNRQLPTPIYSTFNPADYYDDADLAGSTIYTGHAMQSDSLQKLGYRSLVVRLPREFGVKFFREYKENPATFSTPETFAQWFPGLYVTTSFGSGRVSTIIESRINFYFRRHTTIDTDSTSRDTIINSAATYLAVTPEVITNNNLRLQLSSELQERVDSGETIITAPTGSDIEFSLPMREMLESYRNRGGNMAVFNALSIELPAEEIANDYGIEPPTYLLMVLKSKRDAFFGNNELPSAASYSYYATYNAEEKVYIISGMRQYFVDLLEKEDAITEEELKFVLTPVDIEWSEADQQGRRQMLDIAPYINGPAMVKIDCAKAKVRMVYSKQLLN